MSDLAKITPIDKKFIIERQGRPFVLFAGLLHAAHERGLTGITTRILQIGDETNGQTWITQATAKFADGSTWDGIADANPANVNRGMLTVLPRLCETRSVARALRFACNIGMAAFEELGPETPTLDPDDETTPLTTRPAATPPGVHPAQTASPPHPPTPGQAEAASDAQVRAIYAIASTKEMDREELRADVRRRYGRDIEQLSKAQASALISQLKGEAR